MAKGKNAYERYIMLLSLAKGGGKKLSFTRNFLHEALAVLSGQSRAEREEKNVFNAAAKLRGAISHNTHVTL